MSSWLPWRAGNGSGCQTACLCAYLIETPLGSLLWKDTSGHWTGILRDLRPDAALLAAAGRGNIDGEPIQGTLAQIVAREVDLLRPRRIVLGHHYDWNPPMTGLTDLEPIERELALASTAGSSWCIWTTWMASPYWTGETTELPWWLHCESLRPYLCLQSIDIG